MITVFTSCYNQGKYLSEAIESILAQSFEYFEYLLYDDGSTDNTWDIIQHYAALDRRVVPIRVEKQKNVGYVINMSIERMKGDFWTWCPSDDVWTPDLLKVKMATSIAFGHNCIIYSDWEVIQDNGDHHIFVKPRIPPAIFEKEVWRRAPICFTGIWVPKHVFEIAGMFPTHLQFSEDFYWMIKTVIHGIRYWGIPQVLHKKRVHNGQMTKKNLSAILDQMSAIWIELKKYQRKLYDQRMVD